MLEQSGDESTADESSSGDLLSNVGNEIKVTLDRWSVGQLGIADLLVAIAVVAAGALLAWIVSRLARRMARQRTGPVRALFATLGLLAGAGIVTISLAIALEVLGFGLGPTLVLILVIVAGLLLLAPTIRNLSSGVLLQVRGAIEAGDVVRVGRHVGVVREINARSVVLDTSDGRRVHLPNAEVLGETIENYSENGCRRSSLEVVLDGSVDLDLAVSTMEESAAATAACRTEPAPEVVVAGLIGRQIRVHLHVWHGPGLADARAAVDEVTREVIARLAAADVSLDGPQWLGLTGVPADPTVSFGDV